MPVDILFDQYSFKTTGTTTAALVHFMHKVSHMLDLHTNSFVWCLVINFSKAFGTADHVIILTKLVGFAPPAFFG
jgi:hypothetical protein